MAAIVLRVTPQKLTKLIYDLGGNAAYPSYIKWICNADEGTFYVELTRSQVRKLKNKLSVKTIEERYDYIYENTDKDS